MRIRSFRRPRVAPPGEAPTTRGAHAVAVRFGPMALIVGRRAVPVLIGASLLAGCPEPEPEGPCANEPGDPVLVITNRGGGPEIVDGAEVEVFPPPQGGVFTELDVTIDGLDPEDLERLVVTLVSPDTGRVFADVTYLGDVIPLRCTEDDVLVVQYMPVGFIDPVVLEDLDGLPATLTGTLVTARGEFASAHAVVLRVTDY